MDKKYIIASVNFSNSDTSLILNYEVTFLEEVLREQQRIKISGPKDNSDQNLSRLMFSTTVDTCNVSKGVLSNFVTKMMPQNILKIFNSNYTCPFPKNSKHKLVNCTITDKFIPPLPETKFKFEIDLYGKIRGKKRWTYLYSAKAFGSFKK